MFKSRANRLASWIALVAIVFASFAPAVSHAFASKAGTSFQQEICGSHGAKRFISVDLAVDGKQAPSQNQAAIHFEHCPYCANHVANVAIAPTSIALFLDEINAVQNIEIYSAPLVQSYYYLSHPSHAPPTI